MPRLFSSVLVFLLLAPTAFATSGRQTLDTAGIPTFISGELGHLQEGSTLHAKSDAAAEEAFVQAAREFLEQLTRNRFGASGEETFHLDRLRIDELGSSHVRFHQYLRGLRVVGAELVLHTDRDGVVYAVNGHFAPAAGLPLASESRVRAEDLIRDLGRLGLEGISIEEPERVYFHDGTHATTHLAWRLRLVSDGPGRFFDDIVYLDAISGKVVGRDPQVRYAKSWHSYDAFNETVLSRWLPGIHRCSNHQSCGDDDAVQRLHDGVSVVYDYYFDTFGRDSYDGEGAPITASAHVNEEGGLPMNTALWYRGQLMFGEGDGFEFRDLTHSFDIIGHEFTHAVTESEADLGSNPESGALNEAWSDIFGAAADSYRREVIDSATWEIGEESFTPGISGDAIRYMADPTRDGRSIDWYPERLVYPVNCAPTFANSHCGWHNNSGIANLAFKLLVTGGTHPRGKIAFEVPSIGMSKAEQIFYRAQTAMYLTSSSQFAEARSATAQAAADLYGRTEKFAVEAAWCVVGVDPCPIDGGFEDNCEGSVYGASVAGCFVSGDGTQVCSATALGGSGSYNYWWMYEGPGNLYQYNTSTATITGCLDGEGTLKVQVLDRETQDTCLSLPFRIVCDCSPGNDDFCDLGFPF